MDSELRTPNVAIIGFSESTRRLAPYDDPDWEIWLLNRLPIVLAKEGNNNWDRAFDTHTLDESTRQQSGLREEDWNELIEFIHADHGERFGQRRAVYVAELDTDMPSALKMPFEEIVEWLPRRYIASGIAWETAYAMMLLDRHPAKEKRIALYGVDLKADEEYGYQRPNMEWLLGIAEGRGIEVILPEQSALLNSDGACNLYGSPDDPKGAVAEVEHWVMDRVKAIENDIEKRKQVNERTFNELHILSGQKGEIEFLLQRLRLKRRGGTL